MVKEMTTDKTFTNAEKLIAVINEFRKHDPEIQAQAMLLFVKIAQNDDNISMKELQHWSGLANSSISRNVSLLGETNRHGGPGMFLVRNYPDPMDRRRHIVKLTPKGRAVWASLSKIIEG